MTIEVQVRLFARLRELCGRGGLSLELPEGADASDCFDRLAVRHPRLASERDRLGVAVNHDYVAWDHPLEDGDEVTFVPPVSGGTDELIRITDAPVSAARLRQRVARPGCGAIATFEGTVRDHTGDFETDHLVYEAHPEMAEKVFAEIATEAGARWSLGAVAVHHRTGRLEVGEVSVAIAVSAPHRDEAFAACRHLIDELKTRAPIWKKEVGPDGEAWIEGPRREPPDGSDPARDPA